MTYTYIAGDWTGDADLIDRLYETSRSSWWRIHFTDAHSLTQARDSSRACSIKRSLSERLSASKTFVLVVGDHTKFLTKGSCQYCEYYSGYSHRCRYGISADTRSFIEYECEQAIRRGLRIVVLYNSFRVDRGKCPQVLRNQGVHLAAYYIAADLSKRFDYSAIAEAIC